MNKVAIIKIFLRASLATAFLSAVADRLGWWPAESSAWGNWQVFVDYTAVLNPWAPGVLVSFLAVAATTAEILLGLTLLLGFKTKLSAIASGTLIMIFGLAMVSVYGVKAPLDYSVFSAAAAAFGLSLINEKYWELDQII